MKDSQRFSMTGHLLGWLGVLMLVYAFFMDITVKDSSYVNIHLLSKQQNLFYLGGIFFVGGLIIRMLSTARRDSGIFEQETRIVRKNSVLPKVGKIIVEGWRQYFVGLNQGWLSLFLRVLAIPIAINLSLPGVDTLDVFYNFRRGSLSWLEDLLFCLYIVHGFWRAPLRIVLRNFVFVTVLFSWTRIVLWISDGATLSPTGMAVIGAELAACISAYVWCRIKKKSSKFPGKFTQDADLN